MLVRQQSYATRPAGNLSHFDQGEDDMIAAERYDYVDPTLPSDIANDDDTNFRDQLQQRPRPISRKKNHFSNTLIPIILTITFIVGAVSLLIPEVTIGLGVTPTFAVVAIIVTTVILFLAMTLSRLNTISKLIEDTSSRVDYAGASSRELDEIMAEFQNDVSAVSQELQSYRTFVATRFNIIKADFENATVVTARLIDTRMNELSQQIKLAQTDTSLQDKLSHQQASIATQIAQLERQLKSLSLELTEKQDDARQDLQKSTDQIRNLVGELTVSMSSASDQSAQDHIKGFEAITNDIRDVNTILATMPKIDPEALKVDTDLIAKTIKKSIETSVESSIQAANSPLQDLLKTVSQSNTRLIETVTGLPTKIDDYMSGVAPSIAAGIHEMSRRSEARIIDTIERNFIESGVRDGANLISSETPAIDVGEIDRQIVSGFEQSRALIETLTSKIPDLVRNQLEATIVSKIDHISLELKNVMSDHTQRPSKDVSADKENFERTLDAIHKSVANIVGKIEEKSNSDGDVEKLIRVYLERINQTSDSVLAQINEALSRNQEILSGSQSGNSSDNDVAAHERLKQDYSAIEDRINQSLLKFNEALEGGIKSIETAAAANRAAISQDMRSSEGDTRNSDQSEFSKLTQKFEAGSLKGTKNDLPQPRNTTLSYWRT